ILFARQSAVQTPNISSLSPSTGSEGSPDLTITVNGTNFSSTSVVQADGTALTTSFSNDTQLQATLPASLLAEEESLSITVFTPGSSGGPSNALPFVVTDASLTVNGGSFSATEGASFARQVATFSDATLSAAASDFSATISWGDGISTPGTVSANGGGSFSVSGGHTYSDEGAFAITVTLTDVGGASAVANSTAQVADAPLTAAGSPVSSAEGGTFSGVVATFTDANANASASDFTAFISWGDGNTSPGVITSTGSGGFAISGTNAYAEEGTY